MSNERVILCGGVSDAGLPRLEQEPVRLRMWGPHKNVDLHIEDISRPLFHDIPSQFLDLVEVATYVYCADQAVTRGGSDVESAGENWRRKLYFRIPVRNPDLWNGPAVLGILQETLSFVSEDEYYLEFEGLRDGPALQQYLKFSEDASALVPREEVVLFSGGVDSLGGAVDEAIVHKRKVALVTHKPTQKLSRRHRRLCELLAEHAGDAKPIHFPVIINKAKSLGREYTQRTRSFLYASLGATIAQMLGLSRIRFYENGVVSLNLPLAPQVVGARATRTTHPRALRDFAKLLGALAGRPFAVENPFVLKTKADVVDLIAKAGCGETIRYSTSCTHTWEITRLHTHCGACSQCIDRRFAVLAAGQADTDPGEAYKVDLLVGERAEGEPRTMLASYVETASAVSRMSAMEFFSRYGEVSRIVRHLDGSPDANAIEVFKLYQKHAKQVTGVVEAAIARHASAILKRELPASCLVRLVCDSATLVGPGIAVPPAAATRPPATMGDNVFRQTGGHWQVRYAGGKDWILEPSKGAAYLHILLSHPRTVFSAVDLAYQVAKVPQKYALGSAGEGSDEDALVAYREKYRELAEDMEKAEANNDEAEQDRIRREKEWLAEHVKKDLGFGGRLRKHADDRERLRKSFRAAIRRVLAEIAKYDKLMAAHLAPPRLTCGNKPCYDPHDHIEWDT
jgi:hypothetical protein